MEIYFLQIPEVDQARYSRDFIIGIRKCAMSAIPAQRRCLSMTAAEGEARVPRIASMLARDPGRVKSFRLL